LLKKKKKETVADQQRDMVNVNDVQVRIEWSCNIINGNNNNNNNNNNDILSFSGRGPQNTRHKQDKSHYFLKKDSFSFRAHKITHLDILKSWYLIKF
jgi:hypothetical protein